MSHAFLIKTNFMHTSYALCIKFLYDAQSSAEEFPYISAYLRKLQIGKVLFVYHTMMFWSFLLAPLSSTLEVRSSISKCGLGEFYLNCNPIERYWKSTKLGCGFNTEGNELNYLACRDICTKAPKCPLSRKQGWTL